MTILTGTPPVLSVEDNFRLVYKGTYGNVVYDRETNTNKVEEMKGDLPKGKYVWDGIDYLGGMKKGEEQFVPFDVIRLYFGDPRSIMTAGQRFEDKKGRAGDIAPRPEETRRLSVLYGLYDTDARRVHEVVPQVSIFTADDVEIICPAFDPLGEHIYGHVSETTESHDLATTIEQMKASQRAGEERIKALEAMLSKNGNAGPNTGADVEVDGPPSKRGAAVG